MFIISRNQVNALLKNKDWDYANCVANCVRQEFSDLVADLENNDLQDVCYIAIRQARGLGASTSGGFVSAVILLLVGGEHALSLPEVTVFLSENAVDRSVDDKLFELMLTVLKDLTEGT